MKRWVILGLLGTLFAFPPARAGGEIYGTIRTVRGETFRGPIRWDRNENLWDDLLDAQKDRRVRVRTGGDPFSRLSRRVLGWSPGEWAHSQFSIPFGHIRTIEPLSEDRVRIHLKNGDVIRVGESGSDLGEAIRGLVIEDRRKGKITLEWRAVKRIDFEQGPGTGRDADHLHGTVETRRGELTGFIVWDRDEALKDDILDGKERGSGREIRFGEIREVRRRDSRSCRVFLADGSSLVLSGTNDVNADNRGIDVTIPGVGRVEVGWNQMKRVAFTPAPPSPRYDDFDGGRKLRGTVSTVNGESHAGRIVWDNDEEYTWETLDGEADGVDYAVLFENIRSIERASNHSAEVRLKNGETLVLTGSNDVNFENKGIRILPEEGGEVVLDWGEFLSVEFGDPETPRPRGVRPAPKASPSAGSKGASGSPGPP